MRLDKYIVESGLASRSEITKVAKSGGVTVNGRTVSRVSGHIDPTVDKVTYLGREVIWREFTYVMLNKPDGYVSATDDLLNPTVLTLLPEELQAAATEELFHNAFDAIIALFPAIVVVACLLPSFVAHLVAVTVCRRTDYAKKLTLGAQIFVMSKVSAVVFIIAFLLPVLGLGSSQKAQIITVTAENINLMLLPAFLLVGALGIIGFFLRQRGCLNFWSVLALIALIVYGGGFVLYPLAFFGAIRTLRTPRHFRN